MKRVRGFTLVEMMTVVAITGVLAALGANAVMQMGRLGRMNGSVAVLERLLVDARVRTMTQRCTHFVQVNGLTYAPGGGAPNGAPVVRGTANLVRKANCASTNYFFEAGATLETSDRVVASASFGEAAARHSGVYLKVDAPAAWLPSTDVEAGAFTIGYSFQGSRRLARDDSGNGTFTPDLATGDPIILRFAGEPGGADGPALQIPNDGVAKRL